MKLPHRPPAPPRRGLIGGAGVCLAVGLLLGPDGIAAPEAGTDRDQPVGEDSLAPEAKRGPGIARDEDCLVCHAGVGEEEAPKVDLETYRATVHSEEGCIGCHIEVENANIAHEEPDQDLPAVECGRCHPEAEVEYLESAHGPDGPVAKDGKDKARCADCHGNHDVFPSDDARAHTHRARHAQTCMRCHEGYASVGHTASAELTSALEAEDLGRISRLASLPEGLPAGCGDCHGGHQAAAPDGRHGRLYPTHVLKTCGRCHEDEVAAFERSTHAEAARRDGFDWGAPVAEGESKPPVCVTCHLMHAGRGLPDSPRFREDLVHECGTCHERLMETYVESYHGKATLLGGNSAAKCSDCHGYHEVLGAEAADSNIAPDNKLETCRKCHEGAPIGFVDYWPHADHSDRENYPVLYWVFMFMSTLLVSVFSFFGVHTVLWAIRETVDAIRERDQPRKVHSGPRVRRFTTSDRVLHLMIVISFLGLAATGAPMKFAQASWARPMFDLMGGVEWAGIFHRIFAVITFGYFFGHIVQLLVRLGPHLRRRTLLRKLLGPDSMVPNLGDLKDVYANMRWFVGLGPKPTWERFTYWEKFDYWAVFWGVAIIGGSGLVLWFPTTFTYVLPGWAVNVATVIHSDEALLAIGFIFGVHFFNGHLRREKFPMDAVIFTGSVPLSEYQHERGREWARIEEDGRAEELFVAEPSRALKIAARAFGISAWMIGLVILALIVHGFITTH